MEQLSDASSWLHSAASGLEHLELYHTNGVCTAPAPCLPLHKAIQLESLHLHTLKPDIAKLASLTQLSKLSLTDCDMYDRDVCRLSALAGLQSLELSDNRGITGARGSMELLASSMPRLGSLALSRTAAREAAQQAFQGWGLRLSA